MLPFTSAAKIDVIYDGEKLMTLWTRDSGTLFFNTEVSPFIPWGTETLVITGSESHFYSDDYDDDDYDTGIRGRFELLGPVVFSPAVETTLSGRLCGKKLKKRILKLADHDYRRYDDDGDDDGDDYGDDD